MHQCLGRRDPGRRPGSGPQDQTHPVITRLLVASATPGSTPPVAGPPISRSPPTSPAARCVGTCRRRRCVRPSPVASGLHAFPHQPLLTDLDNLDEAVDTVSAQIDTVMAPFAPRSAWARTSKWGARTGAPSQRYKLLSCRFPLIPLCRRRGRPSANRRSLLPNLCILAHSFRLHKGGRAP